MNVDPSIDTWTETGPTARAGDLHRRRVESSTLAMTTAPPKEHLAFEDAKRFLPVNKTSVPPYDGPRLGAMPRSSTFARTVLFTVVADEFLRPFENQREAGSWSDGVHSRARVPWTQFGDAELLSLPPPLPVTHPA